MNAFPLAALPVIALGMSSLHDQDSDTAVSSMITAAAPSGLMMSKLGGAGLDDGPDRSLKGAHLEPSHGLDSNGRGLTPESEWRAMFPRKLGTLEESATSAFFVV